MNTKSIITGFLILLIALVLTSMVLPIMENPKIGRPTIVKMDISALILSLKNYEQEYGFFPGGDSSNVVQVLAGDNPKKIMFLNYRKSSEHPHEMVDPWQTPYQIQFLQKTNFIIRSAGKDRLFGDADDIIFNSASNNFVKP